MGLIESSFSISSNKKPDQHQMFLSGNRSFTSLHRLIIYVLLSEHTDMGSPPIRERPSQVGCSSSLNIFRLASSSNGFPKLGSWASGLKQPLQRRRQPVTQSVQRNPIPLAMSAFFNAEKFICLYLVFFCIYLSNVAQQAQGSH